MSGYAVLARFDGPDLEPAELERFAPPLAPRGPDGAANWHRGRIGVASSVLHTGDPRLDAAVASIDDRLDVAGQVRIDARSDLLAALAGTGRDLPAETADIALFAHAWDVWGQRALTRILGDFSVVIHSRQHESVTLARDPMGVRMLFYAVNHERVIASNTLAAVLAAKDVSRALDEDAIADFIAVGMNENLAGTSYRDVRRVPPGHFVTIPRGGDALTRRYWTFPDPAERRLSSEDAYADGFRAVLTDAVRDRLRTSSVAVFMSGGLDSTSLAAIAGQLLPPTGIHAVTVDLPTIAESPDAHGAGVVAQWLGIRHTVVNGDPFGLRVGVHTTGRAPFTTPEPYADGEVDVWDELLRAAVPARVALYGEDPDSILAPPNLAAMLRTFSPWRVARDIARYVAGEGARPHLGIRHALRDRREHASERDASVGPAWLRADLRARRAERVAAKSPDPTHTRPAVARRMAHPMWQSLLESVDAGMHRMPIDIRLPYLDLRVIEFALSAPPIPWTQRKHLLRRALRGLLPDEVRLRPKSGLVGADEARLAQWWSRNPAPLAPSAALSQFVDISALPPITPDTDRPTQHAHLRLRVLDRWLNAGDGGT